MAINVTVLEDGKPTNDYKVPTTFEVHNLYQIIDNQVSMVDHITVHHDDSTIEVAVHKMAKLTSVTAKSVNGGIEWDNNDPTCGGWPWADYR